MSESLPRGVGLPTFPWDTLAKAKRVASEHPDGIVDLSIGTPVDDTPELIQKELAAHANAPGYPAVVGTSEFVQAAQVWARSRHIRVLDGEAATVIPTIGSKEMVAWLPFMLGVREGDKVLFPQCAYPTYDIGARLAGAQPVAVGDDPAQWPEAAMVWLNSPGNPNGHVLDVEQMRAIVAWAREHNAVVAADECYAALVWDEDLVRASGVPSLLSDEVCEGDPTNLLVLYSLSKQSNMAGCRAGIMAGDKRLVDAVVEVRKHAGMMVSTPVLAAMTAALHDSAHAFEDPTATAGSHVAKQRGLYARRRDQLTEAFARHGLVNDPASRAGLYLWLRDEKRETPALEMVARLAELGILVAPGTFYGPGNEHFIRVSLSGHDERIAAAVRRLAEIRILFPAN